MSSLLFRNTRPRQDGTIVRDICLALNRFKNTNFMDSMEKKHLEILSNRIEGLGVLCTSNSFLNAMRSNPSSTIEILKQRIMNKSFSEEFARNKWP